ncbi:MAG: ribonuclease Z [Candidatus Bathyarchaeota archaeon]|nr:MAG: ribonuclease Z [Candidatus Bathyarchaeota archaeon]
MSIQVVFLGTAGSIPTQSRSLPAIAIKRKGELILWDCGEGVQRQMIIAGLGFNKRTRIFITHMHGDHLFGLLGLIQTMSLLHREKELQIYGPPALKPYLEALEGTVQYRLTFPVEVTPITKEGPICVDNEYEISAAYADHWETAFAFSLAEKRRPGKFHPEKARALGVPEGVLWSKLQHGSTVTVQDERRVEPEDVIGPARPGRKIVYTGDTRPFPSLVQFARGADLLIHECTFDDDLAERAYEDRHSTPTQAAETARDAEVDQLILTHISARYNSILHLLTQAQRVFSNVAVAEDFMRVDLPLKNAS